MKSVILFIRPGALFTLSALVLAVSNPAGAGPNYSKYGFLRARAVSPPVSVGKPLDNARIAIEAISQARRDFVGVLVFPELYLTGYTAEDLFFHRDVQAQTRAALKLVVESTKDNRFLTVVMGMPWALPSGRMINAAVVIHQGAIKGIVPKIHLPNYGEFYERRWFDSGLGMNLSYEDTEFGQITVSTNQIFNLGAMKLAVEICEDAWSVIPPSSHHALAGANVIANLSASNELVGKAEFRRNLVTGLSSQQVGSYIYSSAGPWESTRDLVFGGHSLIAENGELLGQSDRFSFDSAGVTADIDLDKIEIERQRNRTFGAQRTAEVYREVELGKRLPYLPSLSRSYARNPFVPANLAEQASRARDIFDIQVTGLARRLLAVGSSQVVIGVSGGSDSTLALLVAREALKKLDRPTSDILGVTMPGFGTSGRTKSQAIRLMHALGVEQKSISIVPSVTQHFADIDHPINQHDLVFENAQARERTQILFDLANQRHGIVLGTGDLSELFLGWCTYNADHMSNYNVNCSVPKTLVKFMIAQRRLVETDKELRSVLNDILETAISPELLPLGEDGEIQQMSEESFGPYELVDFVMFHLLRNRFEVEKIKALAKLTFKEISIERLDTWFDEILRRFHSQRFKSTAQPAGPKVGSVSLSPRDSRYPDDVTSCLTALGTLRSRPTSP